MWLNLATERVDNGIQMLPHDNNHRSGLDARTQHTFTSPTNPTVGVTSVQVAHELSNLLDGGLRNLNLARSSLQDGPDRQDSQDCQKVLERLDITGDAMQRMATLVRRWMHPDSLPSTEHSRIQTLKQAVDDAVRLLHPSASLHHTEIRVRLSDDVASIPAGPVYTIVANALRNSLQSIASIEDSPSDTTRWHVEITGRRTEAFVELIIRDNGQGLDPSILDEAGRVRFGITTKPDGYGVGLALCRDIAARLGGDLALCQGSPHGATLTLRYPWVTSDDPIHEAP